MTKLLNIILVISFGMTGCYSTGQMTDRDYSNSDYDNGYNSNYNNQSYNSEVSYQVFYDQLQPYGNWINYPGYGYVWQPNAGSGFRPYETNGRWVSTVDGWAWSSNYAWGWAPFHYGRWLNEPGIGWAWVPGYDWAPAWVSWGSYNDYYAWAPLAPGISISMGRTWRAPQNYWSCVPRNRMYHSNFNRYVTRPDRNVVVNNITVINNYNTYNKQEYYNRGPENKEVERYTKKKITPVTIASANNPGATKVDGRQMAIYRPGITNNNENKTAAPARVKTLQEAKAKNNYGNVISSNGTTTSTLQPNNENKPSSTIQNSLNTRKDLLSNNNSNTAPIAEGRLDGKVKNSRQNVTGSNFKPGVTPQVEQQPSTQQIAPSTPSIIDQPLMNTTEPVNNRRANRRQKVIDNNNLPGNSANSSNSPVYQNNRNNQINRRLNQNNINSQPTLPTRVERQNNINLNRNYQTSGSQSMPPTRQGNVRTRPGRSN